MTAETIAAFFQEHWLELAGTLTTGLGIWLTARRTLLCWPMTLAADFLYLIVFYQARLLSDALLQIFFVVFTLYGWWNWWRGVRKKGRYASSRCRVEDCCWPWLPGLPEHSFWGSWRSDCTPRCHISTRL